jgi:hypothetical protein
MAISPEILLLDIRHESKIGYSVTRCLVTAFADTQRGGADAMLVVHLIYMTRLALMMLVFSYEDNSVHYHRNLKCI